MANVPEFIGLLRDIRDCIYPNIKEIKSEIIQLKEDNIQISAYIDEKKQEIIVIRDNTQTIFNETKTYILTKQSEINQLKEDVENLKNITIEYKDETLQLKNDTIIIRDEILGMKNSVAEMKHQVEILSLGLGFHINEAGHLILTTPDGTDVISAEINSNGHLILIT